MGVICLYDVEDNNRGFWLAPEFQGKGYMREASIAATDYWFNTLNKPVLRLRIEHTADVRFIFRSDKPHAATV